MLCCKSKSIADSSCVHLFKDSSALLEAMSNPRWLGGKKPLIIFQKYFCCSMYTCLQRQIKHMQAFVTRLGT